MPNLMELFCYPWFILLGYFCVIFLFSSQLSANPEITVERSNTQEIERIKSAYIYNFLKYVDFSQEDQSNEMNFFNVCILGNDFSEKTLNLLAGRKAKGLEVNVKKSHQVDELVKCHIIYIGSSETENMSELLETVKNHSILTVSEIANFAKNGGMIGFESLNNKIELKINLKNALKANIRISAMLLEIATVVD